MEKKSLVTRAKEARAAIDKACVELQKIQEECTHPRECLDEKYDGDTGNYDPTQDCYWVDRKCGVCGKTWRVMSDEPGYR